MTAPTPAFTSVSRGSKKVRCAICGSSGYHDNSPGPSWMDSHRRGHAPCPTCNKPMPLTTRGNPAHHARCPGPTRSENDQHS